MNFALAAALLPLFAALPLGLFGTPQQGAMANLLLCGVTFLLTLGVFVDPGAGLVHADRLGMVFGALTGFVGLTTAVANLGFVAASLEALSLRRWRVYHAMFQVMLGACLLGLYADNLGLLWVALEGATIAGTVAVSLPRSASALEAAWKYFILGGVGIALALFGTMLTYLAAQPALGPGLAAMSFSALAAHGGALDGALLTLAFVFLLFGYGTKAALVPLHGWLPDAYAEGPAPVTTAMSGLTLNVALLAILRFRHVLQENFVCRRRGDAAGAVPAHAGACLAAAHRLFAAAPARCAAVFRLLLHRAFRHRGFRLRHRRRGGDIRRAAAYAAAHADQIRSVPGADPRRRRRAARPPPAITPSRICAAWRASKNISAGRWRRRCSRSPACRLPACSPASSSSSARPSSVTRCSPAAGAGDGAVRRADPAPSRPAAVRPRRPRPSRCRPGPRPGSWLCICCWPSLLAFAMPLMLFHLLSSVAAGLQ